MKAFRLLYALIFMFSLVGCNQLASMSGPGELVSFGYARPISCERRGPISYNCVVRNHLDGVREVNMECAGFDSQGRMVGRPKGVHDMMGVTMLPGEERVAVVYHGDGASTIVCVDVENSMPPYSRVKELVLNPEGKDITTVLTL